MPDALARFGVEADEAPGEQVVAGSIPTVEIAGRRLDWDIDIPQFFIAGERGPGAGVAGVFPRVVFPGLVAEFTRARDGLEGPDSLPSANIVTPDISRNIFLR